MTLKFGLIAILLGVSGAGFFALSGCGQFKSRDQKVIYVKTVSEDGDSSLESRNRSPELKRFIQFLDIFYSPEGMSKGALVNFLQQLDKGALKWFFNSNGLTPEDLADFFFVFDQNGDGKLTLPEFSDALMNRLPSLHWVTDDQKVTRKELTDILKKQYPDSTDVGRDSLVNVLFRFDEKRFGGNENGLLSRDEISLIQWVAGFLDKVDLTRPANLSPDSTPIQKLALQMIFHKLNQQIFGRHKVLDFEELSVGDLKLEIIQLVSRYLLVNALVRVYGVNGSIPPAKQTEVLSYYGTEYLENWAMLRKFYDSPLALGNQDGALNAFEAFSLLTDLDYMSRVFEYNGGGIGLKDVGRDPEKKSFFIKHLVRLFPRAGAGLFLDGDLKGPIANRNLRVEYWNGLIAFDKKDRGGDENGAVDVGEATLAFAYARILDSLFFLYDKNADGLMSKEEFILFIRTMAKDKLGGDISSGSLFDFQNFIVDVFYANKSFDPDNINFFNVVVFYVMNFSLSGSDSLDPYQFYIRLENYIPEFLKDPKEAKQALNGKLRDEAQAVGAKGPKTDPKARK